MCIIGHLLWIFLLYGGFCCVMVFGHAANQRLGQGGNKINPESNPDAG